MKSILISLAFMAGMQGQPRGNSPDFVQAGDQIVDVFIIQVIGAKFLEDNLKRRLEKWPGGTWEVHVIHKPASQQGAQNELLVIYTANVKKE